MGSPARVQHPAKAKTDEDRPPVESRWWRVDFALNAPIWGWILTTVAAIATPLVYWFFSGGAF